MSAIGPGDWVECIEADAPYTAVSALYCVEAVEPADVYGECDHGPQCQEPALQLQGLRPVRFPAFCAGSFRPIYRPSQSNLLEQLKTEPADLEPA